MNKLIKGIIISAMAFSVVGCGGNSNKKTLKVFNWGEYVDREVISNFEKEFDCNVIYEEFDSNEMMYTKIMGGNDYDVVVPSDYMIERMIKEDLLMTIDSSKMTNLKSVDPLVLGQPFDVENKYWVPYFYGNVGIVYDKTVVDTNDLKDGWNVLKNTKYKDNIYMYDSERDSFMVALKALGYSMNSSSEAEIDDAYNWLVEQNKTMNPVYVGDESIDTMKNGEKAMALMYSGDAAAVMRENENMAFFMPEEGTDVWFDGFVIPKQCKEYDLANEFINYMISDENSSLNTEEIGYLTTNQVASKKASSNEFKGISAYGIRIGSKDEIFVDLESSVKEMYNSRWIKVKAQ